MKLSFPHLVFRCRILLALSFLAGGQARADEVLHNFYDPDTGENGSWPTAGLQLANGVLYGVTSRGGGLDGGTLFSLRTNGTAFTAFFDFLEMTTRDDGLYPKHGLLLEGGTLYGSSYYGGGGDGMLYTCTTNGSRFDSLHIFSGWDGRNPSGSLVLHNGILYGTTSGGGGGYSTNAGTVFAAPTNGLDLETLHVFYPDLDDGASPEGGLVISPSGNTLYGAARSGGLGNGGTLFALGTDGGDFYVLRDFFTPTHSDDIMPDGYYPVAGLTLSPSGDTLYGTTTYGGLWDYGTVFALNPDGSNFRVLHNFDRSGAPAAYEGGTGVRCMSPLVLSGNGKILYGSAVLIPTVPLMSPGITAGGTVFALATDGSAFATLYTCGSWFSPSGVNLDGSIPNRLTRAGKHLYGDMEIGGAGSGGLVFHLDLGLKATVTATPLSAKVGDTIQVVVDVLNKDWETVTNVRLSGPISLTSTNVVSLAGPASPTNAATLAPLAITSFTNLYTATNSGTVAFTAAATGVGGDGIITSTPWSSYTVTITNTNKITTRPTLAIKRASDGKVRLSWSAKYTGYALQRSLLLPVNWQDVPDKPSATADSYYLDIEPQTAGYYRLVLYQQ